MKRMPRTRRHLLVRVGAGIGALWSLALLPMPVQANPARVVLLEPAAAAPGLRRCMTRIRQELAAGGFEVVSVDPGPMTDPLSIANEMGRQPDAVATFAVLGDRDARPSELWILDRIGGHADVLRILASVNDAEHVPEVFAIRAIETLRASALRLLVESDRPSSPAPGPDAMPSISTPTRVDPASRKRPHSATVETGILFVTSPGGLGPAALPLARLRISLIGPLFARMSFAGLGSRPRVETLQGSATVGQALGLFELGGLFRSGARLRPIAAIGGGLLHVDSDGDGIWPYQGKRGSAWAGVVDGGLGVLTELGADVALALEAHAFLALPHPYVRFVDTNAATVGFPAVTVAFTLLVRL
jgi:hypothetical protein